MKKILTASAMLLSLAATAQKLPSRQMAKFKTTKVIDSQELKNGGRVYLYQDKSADLKFLGQATIANADVGKGDILRFGMGAEADWFFKKWVSLNGNYIYGLVDISKIEANGGNTTNKSQNEVTGYQYFEIGGRINIRDRHTKVTQRVVLESRRASHNTTINYYIAPKLPCRRILAVRAGYYGNSAIVSTDMNSKELSQDGSGAVIAKDGTLLSNNYYTNSHTNGAYIGISDMVMMYAVTKNTFKKGSVFLNKFAREMYADILYANTTFDPIVDASGSHEIVADQHGSFQTSKIGGRIGIKNTANSGKIAVQSKFEVGYRPAVSGTGWYVNFGYSFGILK